MVASAASGASRVRRQFLRFAAIGAFGFALATALLYGLRWLGLDLYTGYAIAFLATVTATWWLNRTYTFADRSGSMLAQWARFVAANAVAGAFNIAAFALLMFAFELARAYPVVGTGAGALAGLAVNFWAARHHVFLGARRALS